MSDLKAHDPHLAQQLARRQERERQGDTMTDQNDNTNGNGGQPPLPEAPASLNVKVIDGNGFDVMVTIRDHSVFNLLTNWATLSEYLLKNNYTPTNAPRQAAPPQAPPEPTPAEVEAQINPERAAASQPQSAPPAAGGQSIMAETLVGSVSDGKPYWKVKGERFTEFGINVWPEVLNPALMSGLVDGLEGELNPMTEYTLNGWVAHYSLNQKGKPAKVIGFTRAA